MPMYTGFRCIFPGFVSNPDNHFHYLPFLIIPFSFRFVFRCILEGRPYDSEGGGGLTNFVGQIIRLFNIYFQHELGKKIYFELQ